VELSGVLNIYKEKGMTSHDVVSAVRRLLNVKAGHAGTLDPQAEGVLPVCVGKGTKIADHLGDAKEYRAVVLLGVETDTQDSTGEVIARSPVDWDEDRIRAVAESFRGRIQQIPPMYSAIKIGGRKLYELAREGKTLERAPRAVEIRSLEVADMDPLGLSLTIQVACSKGTYVRTLAHDIGRRLGCGAAMGDLLRLRSGRFSVEGSIRLGELSLMAQEGRAAQAVCPIGEALRLPKAFAARASEKLLRNGNPIPKKDVSLSADASPEDRVLLMLGEEAAGIYDPWRGFYKPAVFLL
jgi:tRNA pseudouridine55 synthase